MPRFVRRFIAPLTAALISAALVPLQAQSATTAVTITVSSSANPAAYAAPVTFTVAVAPPGTGSPAPGGSVSLNLAGYPLGGASLDGAGRAILTVPASPGLFAGAPWGLGAGSNAIVFAYSGDARYAPSQATFTQWINKANTGATASVSGNVQPVSLSATVSINEPSAGTSGFVLPSGSGSSAPSGTVQFFNGTTPIGTATLTPASLFTSTATLPSAVTPANLTAVYSGDANYNPSTSSSAVQPGLGAVTLTATSSANPSLFAAPATLKFSVAPAASGVIPTGSVSASILGLFSLGSVTLDATGQGSLAVPLNAGQAAGVPWGFAAGSNSILLNYSGDAHYAKAQTTITQVVTKADTATTASLVAAAAAGFSIRATVSINQPTATPIGFALPGSNAGSSNPTGSVQFLQGGTVIGTGVLSPSGPLQSTATLPTTTVASTSGNIIVVYNGDANYNGSTSPTATLPSTGAASIAVTSSINPSAFAAPVTFFVTVTPALAGNPVPTGSVHASVFGSDSLADATLDGTGNAALTVPQDPGPRASPAVPFGLATGTNVITLTYSGDFNYAQAQTTYNQPVNKSGTTTLVVLPPVAVNATFIPVTATVRINEPSVTNTAFAIPSGGNLSTSPTGNVDFFNGTALLGTVALTPGQQFQSTATLNLTAVPGLIRAVYYGDVNYNGSNSAVAASTGGLPVSITMASSANPVAYGAALTVAATVAPATPGGPTPTGTLTFYEGSRNLGWIATLDGAGRGTLPIPEPLATPQVCAPACPVASWVMVLGAGSHTITAQYSGDANYAGMASASLTPPVSLVQQITKAPSATTLSQIPGGLFASSPGVLATVADAQPPPGGPFRFMVMGASGEQDGDPSGSVQFFTGSTLIGTAPLAPSAALGATSTASVNTTSTSANSTAVYSGDANFQGSSSAGQGKTATSVQLVSSLNPSTVGQAVTLTATVSPAAATLPPTGTVDFLDGATLLGHVAISGGVATLPATFSTAGVHALSANYSGDANYLSSSTAAFNQSVLPQLVTGVLNLTSNTATAVVGQQVVFVVQVTGTGTVPPHGQIVLLDGAVSIGAGDLSLGSAEVIVTLPAGIHQISAAWAGDANWAAAKSAVLVETIIRATTVTTLIPNGAGTLLAGVAIEYPGAGTPTGTMQFTDTTNQAVLGTVPLTAGNATLVLNSSGQMSDPIVAAYSGDANFAPSKSVSRVLPAIATVAGALTSNLAPEEIATIWGGNLANAYATATLPLPTTLAAALVNVIDSAGVGRLSLLYYASPGQINFVVPAGTASGPASVTVAGTGNSVNVTVSPVVPTLFPVAQIVRVHPDGTQALENGAVPIVFGADSLYLVLYATGVRNRTSLDHVSCTVGSLSLPVTYAGPQSQYPGLDQVVAPLPVSLKGSGAVSAAVTADGRSSNGVPIAFQ